METLRGQGRHEAGDRRADSALSRRGGPAGTITTIVYPSITIQRVA